MEVKKSSNADLENKRMTFVLIGLVFVLALVYVGLEWTQTEVVKYDEIVVIGDEEKEEMVQVTVQEEEIIIEQQPEPQVTPEIINVVDDNVETTGSIQSSESNENIDIPIAPPPPPVVVVDDPDEKKIFQIVEKMPSFPGGEAEMMKYISKAIRYPAVAQENGIQERIIVAFVVEKDGSIADVKVVRGNDPSLKTEAIRVVKSMPKWNAGEQRGKPVRVSYNLPINFKLANN